MTVKKNQFFFSYENQKKNGNSKIRAHFSLCVVVVFFMCSSLVLIYCSNKKKIPKFVQQQQSRNENKTTTQNLMKKKETQHAEFMNWMKKIYRKSNLYRNIEKQKIKRFFFSAQIRKIIIDHQTVGKMVDLWRPKRRRRHPWSTAIKKKISSINSVIPYFLRCFFLTRKWVRTSFFCLLIIGNFHHQCGYVCLYVCVCVLLCMQVFDK